MLRLIALVSLATFTFGNSNSWRIIGGTPAEDGAFPYQASFRSIANTHQCGASILNEYWILTAAFCVVGRFPNNHIIVVGTNKLNSGGDFHDIEEMIYHEDFNSELIINDIALIKLKNPIEFNEKVQPIKLPDVNTGGGVDCVLSGWGNTLEGTKPIDLQFINLKTLTVEECKIRHSPNPVFDTQICTYTKLEEGACSGDSGSALTVDDQQIGIVSWGIPCGIGYPDVYTRVYSYLDWIHDIIGD